MWHTPAQAAHAGGRPQGRGLLGHRDYEMNNSQAALTLEAFTQAQKEYYRICIEAGCARVS